jgi:hypothetical protein
MTTIVSVTNQTIENFFTLGSAFTPQQSLSFNLTSTQIVPPNVEQAFEFKLGGIFDQSFNNPFLSLTAEPDTNGNYQVTIYVFDYSGSQIAPTSGNNTYAISGTTLTLSGTLAIISDNPSVGTITLTTNAGTVVWANVNLNVDQTKLDPFLYWGVSFDDYQNQGNATPSVTINFSISGIANNFFGVYPIQPRGTAYLDVTGLEFTSPVETGLTAALDGGNAVPVSGFSIVTADGITVDPAGGYWSGEANVNFVEDHSFHTLVLTSDATGDTISTTFYGGIYLTLNDISEVTSGGFPLLSGFDGDEDSNLQYVLDGTIFGAVGNFVPAPSIGGAWSGTGPTASGGLHSIYILGQAQDSTFAQSNTVVYSVAGGVAGPPLLNIMVV